MNFVTDVMENNADTLTCAAEQEEDANRPSAPLVASSRSIGGFFDPGLEHSSVK